MNLPEFVFIQSKELASGELILCTRKPYVLIRAYRFEDNKGLEYFLKKYNLLDFAQPAPGYNILLCHVGHLSNPASGPLIGMGLKFTEPELITTIKDAIIFYEENRIKGNETRLKKYVRS